MFRWLSRRKLREQRKLIYQNESAAIYLTGYFGQKGNQPYLAAIEERQQLSQSIAREHADGALVSADDLRTLLDVNRDYRRLFAQTATRHIESFDGFFKPDMGWEKYFELMFDE